MKWINIKDAQPKHDQVCLDMHGSGNFAIAIYLTEKEVNKRLEDEGLLSIVGKVKGDVFASLEVSGHTTKNVIYWMPVTDLPERPTTEKFH